MISDLTLLNKYEQRIENILDNISNKESQHKNSITVRELEDNLDRLWLKHRIQYEPNTMSIDYIIKEKSINNIEDEQGYLSIINVNNKIPLEKYEVIANKEYKYRQEIGFLAKNKELLIETKIYAHLYSLIDTIKEFALYMNKRTDSDISMQFLKEGLIINALIDHITMMLELSSIYVDLLHIKDVKVFQHAGKERDLILSVFQYFDIFKKFLKIVDVDSNQNARRKIIREFAYEINKQGDRDTTAIKEIVKVQKIYEDRTERDVEIIMNKTEYLNKYASNVDLPDLDFKNYRTSVERVEDLSKQLMNKIIGRCQKEKTELIESAKTNIKLSDYISMRKEQNRIHYSSSNFIVRFCNTILYPFRLCAYIFSYYAGTERVTRRVIDEICNIESMLSKRMQRESS